MYLVVRTSSDPAGLAGAITAKFTPWIRTRWSTTFAPCRTGCYDSLARQRFSTTMLGAFAAFALLLAAVGVYGVMSYLVSQSTHDIGVRVALGAQPGNILGLVVRQGMELAAIGIVGGLIGALVLTRVMASLLFGVSATDALTFSAVALILGRRGVRRNRDSGAARDQCRSHGGPARRIDEVRACCELVASNAFRVVGSQNKGIKADGVMASTPRGATACQFRQFRP